MSVIVTQFPDPVMKKHKSPSYTQQDYDVVDFMNMVNTPSATSHANISKLTMSSKNPSRGASEVNFYDSGTKYADQSYDFSGTKMHIASSKIDCTAQLTGHASYKLPNSTRSYRDTAKTAKTYIISEINSEYGSTFMNRYYASIGSSSTDISISTGYQSINKLITCGSSFKIGAFANGASATLTSEIPSNATDIRGSVHIRLFNVSIRLNIDYVILSTGETVYKGQTIS